jgi:hypothetical protein
MFWFKIATLKFVKLAPNVNSDNKIVKLADFKHERAVPQSTIWVEAKITRTCKIKPGD